MFTFSDNLKYLFVDNDFERVCFRHQFDWRYADVPSKIAAFWMNEHQDHNVILAAHTQEHSNQLIRRAKTIAESNGIEFSDKKHPKDGWGTAAGGRCRPCGVFNSLAGFGVDLVIVTATFPNNEYDGNIVFDWYTSNICMRLNPGGRIVIVGFEDDRYPHLANDLVARATQIESERWVFCEITKDQV